MTACPALSAARRAPALLLALLLAAGCSGSSKGQGPQDPASPPPIPAEEVAFGPAPGQVLDVYRPPARFNGRGPFPAVIHVHGGAWAVGDKEQLAHPSRLLAEMGFVVFTTNYRLVRGRQNRWPTCWNDTRMALEWVLEHAAKFEVDPGRIGALGYSAGGHLVALLGTRPETRRKIRAVVDFFGPADMRPDQPGHRGSWLLIGPKFNTPEQVYLDASPVVQASAEAPPFLILHGDKDRLVPVVQSQRLARVLREKGVDVTLKVYPGESHAFNRKKSGEQSPASADSWRRTFAFLQKHLLPPGGSAGTETSAPQ